MRSISELVGVAENYLEIYCSPTSGYAWPHYDRDLSPATLTPTDLLAPALLSYPIDGRHLRELLRDELEPSLYAALRRALEQVVADSEAVNMAFDDLDADQLAEHATPGWGSVLKALDAVQPCRGLTSVAVTKILHRKRSALVPLVDSRLRTFYGVTDRSYAALFQRIHADMTAHRELLDIWRAPYRLDDRTEMSRLRALDIVVWMDFEPVGTSPVQ